MVVVAAAGFVVVVLATAGGFTEAVALALWCSSLVQMTKPAITTKTVKATTLAYLRQAGIGDLVESIMTSAPVQGA